MLFSYFLILPAAIINPIPDKSAEIPPIIQEIPMSPNACVPAQIPTTPTIINKTPIILILRFLLMYFYEFNGEPQYSHSQLFPFSTLFIPPHPGQVTDIYSILLKFCCVDSVLFTGCTASSFLGIIFPITIPFVSSFIKVGMPMWKRKIRK